MPMSWSYLAAFLRPDQIVLLAAQAVDPAAGAENILLQQGPIGAILVIALGLLWILLRREMARADKAEADRDSLHKLIREDYVPTLTRTSDALARNTDALARVADLLDDLRREERKGR